MQLKNLHKIIQKVKDIETKNALHEIREILEWFEEWLENIEESISKTEG